MENYQFTPEQEKIEKLTNLYNDENFVTLYRYENPNYEYDSSGREDAVSRHELVGQWFTSNLNDLKTYTRMRQPGGNIITVRICKQDLSQYDAMQLEQTQNMDIEPNNYIIPNYLQDESKIEIPINISTASNNKFLFSEWGILDKFIDDSVSSSKKILDNIKI